jgi:Fe-S-cluster-containing dehydrogenase component
MSSIGRRSNDDVPLLGEGQAVSADGGHCFSEAVAHDGSSPATEHSRREFLRLMGASLALAGASGCIRMPEEKLVPYAHRPPSRTPGVPVSYATAMEIGGIAQGLLVTSYDGRPIKIEGNPNHPLNRGACDAIAQASILELYDPDRSRGVIRRNANGKREASSWEEFARWAKGVFKGDGKGICVLSEASSSPSLADMRRRFQAALPKAEWFECEPFIDDAARGMSRLSRRVLDLSQAKVVLSLDADLFGGGSPLAIKYARDFASGRLLHGPHDGEMNRLYVVESVPSITGACADHRRAVPASAIEAVAVRLATALGIDSVRLAEHTGGGVDQAFLDMLSADLKANAGRSAVVAGSRQSGVVHSLAMAINEKLGNLGKTVVYHRYADLGPDDFLKMMDDGGFENLVEKINQGQVRTLLILGGNPVYRALADLNFAQAIGKAGNTIHLGLHDDETSQHCDWHLSRTHYLESWGDARTYDESVSIVQPLIEPMFDGRSAIEVLAMILGDKEGIDGGGYEIVRRSFRSLLGKSFSEWKWRKALADGVVEGTARASDSSDGYYHPPASYTIKKSAPSGKDNFELVFFTDAKVYDGRFANNGWLQEFPDPMTRLTWGNAALMNEKTAAKIGVKPDELVALEAGGPPAVEFPVLIQHGMPDGVIAVALGYGRTAAGNIGGNDSNPVGGNAYLLRDTASIQRGWTTVTARPTGKTHRLATVQDHHIIDRVGKEAVQERIPELIHEGTLAEYRKDPSLGHKKSDAPSIFDEHRPEGHRWGIAVDLTACTGCGACVVACQAENNIPIVGREQVLLGREMHWIRVDRYCRTGVLAGSEPARIPALQSLHQPVLCMQCENAPCEEVCPFAATTHSTEGLNMMTYNRCGGTRYCSNNCPYKVRRFNYFDFNCGNLKDLYTPNLAREPISELLRMQKNPEVTVRMRGVMEKCTYCIQRIEHARIAARRDADRPIRDGEIQTACQQTCPAGAIVFGDLNDPSSRVSKLHALARSYGLLNPELNTKPRTRYLARIRNPAPGLKE